MRKVPTLYLRDPADMRRVLPEVNPACQWVLDGEGVATRKYDGVCIRIDEAGDVWARQSVKDGQEAPPNFAPVDHDPETGKTFGWVPIRQSGFAKYVDEAMETGWSMEAWAPRTYELCGPKINGNHEGFGAHTLVPHGGWLFAVEADDGAPPRDFEGLRDWLTSRTFEGIVWHHPDGRMAKLKKRDFR